MFNVHPTHSQKLARTIQRDYEQAAEKQRLLKQNGAASEQILKVGLLLTVLVAAFVTFTQFVV